MANTTVYPYGTGGSLPSSVGIINDLTTGGADKALSAEQGVVLKGMVDSDKYRYDEINLALYYGDLGNYINLTNNVWASSTASKSFFVPIEPGKTYRVTSNESQPSRIAILKTNVNTANTTPDYATGETALHFWSGVYEFTAPSDAHYISLNYTLAGDNICPSYLGLKVDRTEDLEKRVYNIENDIDTSDGYAYEGEKIVVNSTHKYSLQLLATNSIQAQTAALYGKYLFIIKDKFTTVLLYNMETMSQVYTWNTGQSVDTWHCNQASFGIEKVESSDMFPVLYISQRPDSGSTRGIVQAYRIIPTLSGETITSFTMVLAQTINLPAMTSQNALGLPNATIDTENGLMWTYSRDTSSGGNGLATFTKFAIPSLSSATVTLEDSDILDSFQEKWQIYDNQGAFIHKGKLYMMRGVPAWDQFVECNVIDLYFTRTRVSRVELYANGFTYEPQGCFYYHNTVCFTTNNNRMYQINF